MTARRRPNFNRYAVWIIEGGAVVRAEVQDATLTCLSLVVFEKNCLATEPKHANFFFVKSALRSTLSPLLHALLLEKLQPFSLHASLDKALSINTATLPVIY